MSEEQKQELSKADLRLHRLRIMEMEHRLWQAREERKTDSKIELEDKYKRHVHEANWHNRIFSLAMVFAVTFLAMTLAKVAG